MDAYYSVLLVVRLGLQSGLDLVFGWSVVIHTYIVLSIVTEQHLNLKSRVLKYAYSHPYNTARVCKFSK